jgi:hypothetical protein
LILGLGASLRGSFFLCLLPGVQGEADSGTDVFFAANMDIMAVGFDDVFANGKPEPAARDVSSSSFGGSEEALEDPV